MKLAHLFALTVPVVTGAFCSPGIAQDFPNRPITLICPWPAGGSTDQHLRIVAQLASKHLGQQVIVDNKPGAGGTLGDLQLKTGAQYQHVPFKSNAEGMNAFLGGHIDAMSDASGWGTHADSGKARLLATFTEQRTKRWPTSPTAREQGLDIVYPSPYGLAGPKGMEPKVVQVLHDAFKKALDDPEHQKTLEKLDQILWYKNSADYTKYAMDTYESERATLERLGLQRKE